MFSAVFLDVSFIGKETDALSEFVPLRFGRLVAFLLGPGGAGILAESLTVSFFPGKGMKAKDLFHFCLSKITQRLEVESLLVSAMLF